MTNAIDFSVGNTVLKLLYPKELENQEMLKLKQ